MNVRSRSEATDDGDELSRVLADRRLIVAAMQSQGVPRQLLESISRKCLRTPRRQTGRVDYRTNRESRWRVVPDHPDYASEAEANRILLRLLVDALYMRNAPSVDTQLLNDVWERNFPSIPRAPETSDPITDEALDWNELVADIVDRPVHGYSLFHIGHQNPKLRPKHRADNIRWQLKPSNDFQGGMVAPVARIAYRLNQLTEDPDASLLDDVMRALEQLMDELGLADAFVEAAEKVAGTRR